jgi:hypothetical protein
MPRRPSQAHPPIHARSPPRPAPPPADPHHQRPCPAALSTTPAKPHPDSQTAHDSPRRSRRSHSAQRAQTCPRMPTAAQPDFVRKHRASIKHATRNHRTARGCRPSPWKHPHATGTRTARIAHALCKPNSSTQQARRRLVRASSGRWSLLGDGARSCPLCAGARPRRSCWGSGSVYGSVEACPPAACESPLAHWRARGLRECQVQQEGQGVWLG